MQPYLWLGNVDGLADHRATMQDKQQSSGVELQGCAFGNKSKGNVLVGPALRHTVGHKTGDIQSSGNGSTFEVLGLAALVLGQYSHSDVEPG